MDWIGAMSALSAGEFGGAVECTSWAGRADGACGGPLGTAVPAPGLALVPLAAGAGAAAVAGADDGAAAAAEVAGVSSGVGSLSIGIGPSSEVAAAAGIGCCWSDMVSFVSVLCARVQ